MRHCLKKEITVSYSLKITELEQAIDIKKKQSCRRNDCRKWYQLGEAKCRKLLKHGKKRTAILSKLRYFNGPDGNNGFEENPQKHYIYRQRTQGRILVT